MPSGLVIASRWAEVAQPQDRERHAHDHDTHRDHRGVGAPAGMFCFSHASK